MNEYGKGSVLGAVSILPSTAAGGLLLTGHGNPLIIAGLFIISGISLLLLIAHISRYQKNTKA